MQDYSVLANDMQDDRKIAAAIWIDGRLTSSRISCLQNW